RKRRCLTRIIWNLEVAMVPADEKNKPAGVVENIGRIAEQFVLVGIVMDRVAASSRILDADAVVQVIRCDVIVEFPGDAAVLDTRHDRVETSAIHGGFALLKDGAVLRVNVDYASRAKAELRRQRAGDERDVVSETRLEFLTETGNAFRQQHVIDAVLQIRVLTADVKLPERILSGGRKTQHGLVKRRVFTSRL